MESRKNLLNEKIRLQQDILTMATMVEENIGKAIIALRTRNPDLANEVRADDSKIDILQHKIEDDASFVIATQQPVARDLRELVTIIKLTNNIERIGDYAVHLAKTAKKLAKNKNFYFREREHCKLTSLEKMAETGREMIRCAISAFMAQDAQAARIAAAMDNIINAEHKELTVNILKVMKNNPDSIKNALLILRTSNQLERLGDHITNICEAIIYMIEAKHEEL
jgi:phosphate transport system protein